MVITDRNSAAAFIGTIREDGSWDSRQIVRFGEGPDELRSIEYLARLGDGFIVGDARHQLVFDLTGQMRDKTEQSYPAGDLGISSDGFVVHPGSGGYTVGENAETPSLIETYTRVAGAWVRTSELLQVDTLKRPPDHGQESVAFMGFVTLANGRIWFSPRFENSLFTSLVQDDAGTFFHFDDAQFERFEYPSRDDWVVINYSLAALPDGSVLVGRGPRISGLFTIDRFDADGRLLQEIKVDLPPTYMSADSSRLLVADGRLQNRVVLFDAPW
ncbi:MAG: hypothetical protein ACLFP4_12565 [Spirochaetales bacterium]